MEEQINSWWPMWWEERQVFNLYGPTEDTTYSTYALVERGQEERVHIGRPIANTQVYLLDGELELVPRGVTGEIYRGRRRISERVICIAGS